MEKNKLGAVKFFAIKPTDTEIEEKCNGAPPDELLVNPAGSAFRILGRRKQVVGLVPMLKNP